MGNAQNKSVKLASVLNNASILSVVEHGNKTRPQSSARGENENAIADALSGGITPISVRTPPIKSSGKSQFSKFKKSSLLRGRGGSAPNVTPTPVVAISLDVDVDMEDAMPRQGVKSISFDQAERLSQQRPNSIDHTHSKGGKGMVSISRVLKKHTYHHSKVAHSHSDGSLNNRSLQSFSLVAPVAEPKPRPVSQARPDNSFPHIPKIMSLDQFQPVRQVGTGSFGVVTLSRHRPTGVPCVVKMIHKRDTFAKKQHEHVLWERFTLATLTLSDCPFTVRALGMFQDPENLYVISEFVPGGELFTYLGLHNSFNEATARFYVAQLLLALEHMHDYQDIVYRDIKPENILLDADGYIRIVDFGFAKRLRRNDRTFTVCGTPDYLAPEVLLGKGHGREVDLWATGVFMWELLTGTVPFTGPTRMDMYRKIIAGRYEIPAHFSPAAADLIAGLLTVDRAARLGCSVDGIVEVRAHPWFDGFDWEALLQKRMRPPILPVTRGPWDPSNYASTTLAPTPSNEPLDVSQEEIDAYFQDFDVVLIGRDLVEGDQVELVLVEPAPFPALEAHENAQVSL